MGLTSLRPPKPISFLRPKKCQLMDEPRKIGPLLRQEKALQQRHLGEYLSMTDVINQLLDGTMLQCQYNRSHYFENPKTKCEHYEFSPPKIEEKN
ncbi:uncharacterized protein Dsimw501_GD28268 [Drosophila simulans]|nr:uncharacterized protein Dsimw501_GD28268 [Drosophila simulans]